MISVKFMEKWPVTVHCWGGLGSQLYAWILATRLKTTYKLKRVTINFHTNGITRRDWEIPFSLGEIGLKLIDDYAANVDSTALRNVVSEKVVFPGIKQKLRYFVQNAGFIGVCDTEEDLNSLKPWVIQVRGHYSYLEPTVEEAKNLHQLLMSSRSSLSKMKFNACHYRLGDLTSLVTKSYISWERLSQIVARVGKENDWIMFSDSPIKNLSNLSINLEELNCTWLNTKTLEVIERCIQAENFVGTNSKISVWIAMLRINVLNKGHNFLPKELEFHPISSQHADSLVYY